MAAGLAPLDLFFPQVCTYESVMTLPLHIGRVKGFSTPEAVGIF